MNKNYLTYLFRQRKVAYLFFILLYAAISLSPFIQSRTIDGTKFMLENTAAIAAAGSIIFTYVLPVVLFSFMHRKRSVDLYFALPVNRKELLITTLVFIIGFSWLCYVGTVSIAFLLSHTLRPLLWLKMIGFMLMYIVILTLFNTALYMIANNIFDGIVMMGAYTCFPLFVYIIISSFFDVMVAGQNGYIEAAQVAAYFSPFWMGVKQYGNILDSQAMYIPHLIMLVLFGLVSLYVIRKEFVERSTERAEQVSDGIFSYPLVINIYALIILAGMSFGRINTAMIRNNIPWYLILLMIYIVAMFVYRRKIQVKLKDLVIYGIGLILSLVFSFAAWQTRGFGLADNYRIDTHKYIHYDYNATVDKDNLGEHAEWKDEIGISNEIYVNYTAEFPTADLDKYRDVIDLFENKRKQAIDEFYKGEDHPSCYLGVFNSDKSIKDGYTGTSYHYNIVEPFTEQELKLLDQYGDLTIYAPEYDDMNDMSLSEYLERRGE